MKQRVFIKDKGTTSIGKEALLILPGFGSKIHGTKKIAAYFFDKGYDVFIPHYISRKSINDCVMNLNTFITKYKLDQYKKIHVFSYIIGSWVINAWIKINPENNIATIIYDRSPLQERAPYAVIMDIPIIARIFFGKIMNEFAVSNYKPFENEKIAIGILVESKASKLIIKHKKSALLPGPISWDVKDLSQSCNDYLYAWLDHDEMYFDFELTGNEIFHFIKNRRFTDNAKRTPFSDDPFIPKKAK